MTQAEKEQDNGKEKEKERDKEKEKEQQRGVKRPIAPPTIPDPLQEVRERASTLAQCTYSYNEDEHTRVSLFNSAYNVIAFTSTHLTISLLFVLSIRQKLH